MNLWRWAALAAVGVILCAIGFASIPNINVCGTANDPILAFEFVRSPFEVAALFPENCRGAAVEAQRTGLLFDALVFIPIYSALLILSLVALRRERGTRLATAAIAAVIVAALLDEFEGLQLWAILSDMPGTQETIALLMPAVRGKFLLLALATAAIGWLHIRARNWRMVTGAAMSGGSAWAILGLFTDYRRVMGGSAIAWLALIITTLILAFRPPRTA